MMEFEEPIEVHGVPVYFQKVDNPDEKWREAKLDWMRNSEAVKSRAHVVKRIEIATIAGFAFMDEDKRFHCTKYDRETTVDRCRNGYCVDWSESDMKCSADAMGEYVEEQEPFGQMLLDTMHVLRTYHKPKEKQ